MSFDFKQVLADAGIPVSEDTAMLHLRQIAAEENAPFNNLSKFSPFGRLLSLLFVKPFLWLVNFHATTLLPSLYLKTATGQWVDMFAWQLGLTRKAATKTRGIITLTRYKGAGRLAVPIGTVIQSAAIAGRVYRMLVTQEGVFEDGQTTLSVVCEAEQAGSAHNLADGFYALVSSSLSGIASVSNTPGWLVVPGADEENDDELKARCRNQFTASNRWHIDASYLAIVSEFAGVGIEDIYIEHNAPRGPGTANIYILSNEQSPSPEFFTAIQQHIMPAGNHGLGDDVAVLPMPTRPIDVSMRIRLAGWLSTAERAAVESNIRTVVGIALRSLPPVGYAPTRVMPNTTFAWSVLIRELHDYFPSLRSVDFLGADDDLQPTLWVTRLGTLTVESLS